MYEHRKDSGRLMASQTKKHEKSPDYWGEIAIDVKDLTKVEQVNGLLVFKINGWKRKTQAGATYLSLAIDRYVSDRAPKPAAKPTKKSFDDLEDDFV
jgi:hypothetical protein